MSAREKNGLEWPRNPSSLNRMQCCTLLLTTPLSTNVRPRVYGRRGKEGPFEYENSVFLAEEREITNDFLELPFSAQ